MGSLNEFSIVTRAFLKVYRWQQIDTIPFVKLNKTVDQCKIALVSSAGLVLPNQTPFSKKIISGDSSHREIPNNTDVQKLIESHRSRSFDQTGLPWVPPSPNMPTVDTATLYPGMCLLEGTNLSEGRGTTKPFEWIGAPWIDGCNLAKKLNLLALNGVLFRQIHFKPEFSKYAKEMCSGVQVHITDRLNARPTEISLHLISTIMASYPDQFEFRSRFFNLLTGTDQIQEALLNSKSVTEISQSWQPKNTQFDKKRQAHFIY